MSLESQVLVLAEAPSDFFGTVALQYRRGMLVLIRKEETLIPAQRDNRRDGQFGETAHASHDRDLKARS
jgi:hypothetical protein